MERVSVQVPASDLADVYQLLLERELARLTSATAPSSASANNEPKDDRSEWQAQVAQIWSGVMPQSNEVLGYLVEHGHRAKNPIGFYPLQNGAGIERLGGAIKSIYHWTRKTDLPDHALLRSHMTSKGTVYWVDEDVAEFLRTLM